jgi:MFS transporter, DHA1 family, multidrug resistance protein
MLAMDFYLPAVPSLQGWFGVDVTVAQATIAVFLLGLAASQLLWAEVMSRRGPRVAVRAGLTLLVATSVVAALAPAIEVLLAARLLQGVAAGAATVVAPSVVRATLPGTDVVRGIAAISMVEAIVPAIGPLLGAMVLAYADWRATFWLLAVATLVATPFAQRATPRELPGIDRLVVSTYRSVLANAKFVRLAVSHALGMGALLTFIASAPQLMSRAEFGLLQVIGVSSFILFASQAGRISKRIGAHRSVQVGAVVQVLVCAVALLASSQLAFSYAAHAVFWFVFCGALAVRGPAAFSEALDVAPSQLGRASALMVLAILAAGAIGTQIVAPSLRSSGNGLLVAMLVACVASVLLVTPYPLPTERR